MLNQKTNIEINEYVNSRPWSISTKKTARAKLRKIYSISTRPEEVESYLEASGYARYTIKQYFILISGFDSRFKGYYENRKNLFRNAYKTKTREVTETQVQAILDNAGEYYNLIYFMAFCGLRLSEALAVKKSDFIRPNILSVVGKGDKQRLVPCNAEHLREGPEEAVNPTRLRDYLLPYGLTPHDLRAFFITRTTRARKIDLDEVATIVGHSSLNTTQRYLRSNIDEITRKLLA